jgi:hypothetical protein
MASAMRRLSSALRRRYRLLRRSGDRMIDGPLFVGEDYLIRRKIVALSETKRTESYWVRSQIFEAGGRHLKAEMLLNHAVLKNSFAGYEAARSI